MRCRKCGEPLRADEGVCPRCGATQDQEAPAQAAASGARSGVPIASYAPSRHGPPVAPDTDPPSSASRTLPEVPGGRVIMRRLGYHAVVLPPPPRGRGERRWRASRSVLGVLALFALLGLAAGVVARGGNVPIPGLAVMQAHPTATATPMPACPPAPVAHTTAPALGSLQLTTSLKNAKQRDYRPVNNVTRFTVGTQAYVTFKVLSSQVGTADVVVCTPAHRLTGSVPVPKASTGQYVEFPVTFGSADVGQGMVTISWDGSVAANQAFSVVRCPSPVAGGRTCG